MKTLGTTVDGNFIVEMTPDEHWSFVKVEASVNGKGLNYLSIRRSEITGANLAPIFQALDRLYEAKISINEIKEYVDFLDKVFGNIK